ncbi:MAG: hypothetical protein AcusKO_10460 [Acuticoccus sp.]
MNSNSTTEPEFAVADAVVLEGGPLDRHVGDAVIVDAEAGGRVVVEVGVLDDEVFQHRAVDLSRTPWLLPVNSKPSMVTVPLPVRPAASMSPDTVTPAPDGASMVTLPASPMRVIASETVTLSV